MERSALLLALVLGATLPVHAQTRDYGKPPPARQVPAGSSATCSQRVCNLTVTAKSCREIVVTPDEQRLKGRRDYELVWTIPADMPATFRDQGIFFKESRSAPLVALGIKRPLRILKGGTEIRVAIEPKGGGPWYYGVQLVHSGKKCPDHDPVIINEM